MSGEQQAGGRSDLFLIGAAAFGAMASMRICDALLPNLADAFDVSTGTAASVIAAFVVAYGLLQLVYGPMGDRFGKQRIINLAVAASAVINLALVFAPTFTWLVALRFVAGAAAAGIIPLCMAHIGDTVPYAERQGVLAKFMSVVIMGMISGQWLGGLLADFANWRSAFVVITVLFSVVSVIWWRTPRAAPVVPPHGHTGTFQQIAGVLRIPWARTVLLVAMIEGAFVFSSLAFIPSYLHQSFSLSLTAGGAIVALFGMGGLVYAFGARMLLARMGENGLAWLGGGLLGLGLGMLAFGNHWAWALPACFTAGLGFYMLHNTLQANATQMAPHARGTAVSFFACALFFGQSVGIGSVGAVVDTLGLSAVYLASMVGLPLLAGWFALMLQRRSSTSVTQST